MQILPGVPILSPATVELCSRAGRRLPFPIQYSRQSIQSMRKHFCPTLEEEEEEEEWVYDSDDAEHPDTVPLLPLPATTSTPARQ